MKSLLIFIFLAFSASLFSQPTDIAVRRTVYVSGDTTINLSAFTTTLAADLAEGSLTVTISEPVSWNEGWEVRLVQFNTSVANQVTINTTAASGNEFRASNSDASLLTLVVGSYDVKVFVCSKTSASGRQWLAIEK